MSKKASGLVSDNEFARLEWARVQSWSEGLDTLLGKPVTEFGRERKAAVQANRAAAQPIVEELQALGIPRQEIGELSNVRLLYPSAAPILLSHLARDHPEGVRLDILQTLARPYGHDVFEVVRDLLRQRASTVSELERFKYGDALAANAVKSDIDDILEMLDDPRLGEARIQLALKAARWKDGRVKDAIIRFFREGSLRWAALRSVPSRRFGTWSKKCDLTSTVQIPTCVPRLDSTCVLEKKHCSSRERPRRHSRTKQARSTILL